MSNPKFNINDPVKIIYNDSTWYTPATLYIYNVTYTGELYCYYMYDPLIKYIGNRPFPFCYKVLDGVGEYHLVLDVETVREKKLSEILDFEPNNNCFSSINIIN